MEPNPKSPESPSPHPKVSPKKYTQQPAKVRFRLKGSGTEGDLYQGQRLIRPCRTCGNKTKN